MLIDLVVNLSLELIGFLLFNLPMFEHLDYEVIFIMKQEVLSSSVLNGFADFWEHAFNIVVKIIFSTVHLLF